MKTLKVAATVSPTARPHVMPRAAAMAGALLVAALLPAPFAAQAQQSGVEDSSAIGGFRLDQPAGPRDPDRPTTTTPRVPSAQPSAPNAQSSTQPSAQPAAQPSQAAPQPSPAANGQNGRTSARDAQPARSTPAAPATQRPAARSDATVAPEGQTAPALPAPTAAPDASLADGEAAQPMADGGAVTDAPAAEAPKDVPSASTSPMGLWPWLAVALVVLGIALGLYWRKQQRASTTVAADTLASAPAPLAERQSDIAPSPTPAAAPPPAPAKPAPSGTVGVPIARAPSGTVGVPIAKVAGGVAPSAQPTRPAPSAVAQGFVTTRAPKAEPPRPAAAPAGTVGIPASRIVPVEPPPPAPQLVEGTKIAAQFAAPELIRDDDGLRLKFALGIGNVGTMAAREVQLRTVLLTAAPDSDRLIADWMRNPAGPAVTEIPEITGGSQTNITGEIQLTADQIRAMTLQGQTIFVPMFAISVDFLGAEGLDRFGEAYVIGLPPERAATNGKARVLPLPHDGKLPRRWTDLLHSKAAIA